MKTLIAGLIAFTLVAGAGMAFAGQSTIQINTYTTYGGVWENLFVAPDYMDEELFYTSDLFIDWGQNVGTMAFVSVPDGIENDDPTMFIQTVEADEIGDNTASYSDLLTIESLAGEDDSVYHYTELTAWSIGDPYDMYPTVSNDLVIMTAWMSDADTALVFDQDIYVDQLADDQADAFGTLYSGNWYGDMQADWDYVFQTEVWGSTLEFELDWMIGAPSS